MNNNSKVELDLSHYRRKSSKEKLEIRNRYEEVFKNNKEYFLECIEDMIVTVDNLSQSEFRTVIWNMVRVVFENEGIRFPKGATESNILNQIIDSQRYWRLYKSKIKNLEYNNVALSGSYVQQNNSNNVKEAKECKINLSRRMTIKDNSFKEDELEDYKLNYLFYTTDTDSEKILLNKEKCSKQINIVRTRKKYICHSNMDFKNFGSVQNTVKVIKTKTRVGHSNIYCRNLEMTMSCCPITKISDISLLRHSHIKPWSVSTDEEKLDGYNGLLLEYGYDMLFDKGWISFENNGLLLISPRISKDLLKVYWLLEEGKVYNIYNESGMRNKYLDYHRKNIFKS